MTQILKYFYEEPVLVEPVTPDADPDARQRASRSANRADASSREDDLMPLKALLNTDEAYRGYLAGTDLGADTVGLTSLPDASLYVDPVVDALGEAWWGRSLDDGTVEALTVDAAREVLAAPGDATTALVTASGPVEAERITAAAGRARRETLPALRALLDAASVAFFPEPAHDGYDWSFFCAHPMRDRLVDAFRQRPAETARRFVLPYQKARSESKFYFETWQLSNPSLPDYIEEV